MSEKLEVIKIPKKYADVKTKELGEQFDQLQRQLQAKNIPVLILLEGWESSGKGHVLKNLTREMDPRYVRVEVFEDPTDVEEAHERTWRYWQKIPSREEIVVYDRSFYHEIMQERKLSDKKLKKEIKAIQAFEKMLTDDDYILLKFFLNISQEGQKKRIKALEKSDYQQYLLDDSDYQQNKHYDKFTKHFNKILELTHTQQHPWQMIDAEDVDEASKTVLAQTLEWIQEEMTRIEVQRQDKLATDRHFELAQAQLPRQDLSKSLTEEAYDAQKEALQEKAASLVYECYTKDIPIVLAFEGVDAAGKGGAIQRLTRHIDPRSYKIYGIKAPTAEELTHHYLWRFQTKFPENGQMSIFDRSWYGRVLVERIEGFAHEKEWERSYEEINQMEARLTQTGTILMKFFLYIDKDEQAQRFEDRQEEEDKQYKITEEDWRNRKKWDAYEVAYEEMLARTHQKNAPWYLIASNDKYYARIKVLETFINHVENILSKKEAH